MHDDVVDVALAFNLVTRYTSLVAVEEFPTAMGAMQARRIPGVLPSGGTNQRVRLLVGLVLVALGLGLVLMRARRPL